MMIVMGAARRGAVHSSAVAPAVPNPRSASAAGSRTPGALCALALCAAVELSLSPALVRRPSVADSGDHTKECVKGCHSLLEQRGAVPAHRAGPGKHGRSKKVAKEIAARTVNKARAVRRHGGGRRPTIFLSSRWVRSHHGPVGARSSSSTTRRSTEREGSLEDVEGTQLDGPSTAESRRGVR
jgi:hypothetical protein